MFLWLEKGKWDLLISDVRMPNMSGYELTRIVRSRFPLAELPILLLNARNHPEDILTSAIRISLSRLNGSSIWSGPIYTSNRNASRTAYASTLERLQDNGLDKESGIGLISTDRRLRQLFGTGLALESGPEGTTVSFVARDFRS